MNTNWQTIHQLIQGNGFTIATGLTDTELERAEAVIGGKFPPDLREFLAFGLPIGKRAPNWREPDSESIREQLAWPFDGMAFDIENNVFWLRDWGPRPTELKDALEIARKHVSAAPKLIPIFGHRYIPAEPELAGNPVFSVYQTDIIYYGTDLMKYFLCEFNQLTYEDAVRADAREVRFWSKLVEANNG